MSKITREMVEHIAKLARLDLTDNELDKFAGDLSAITEAISILEEVPTDDVKPTLIVNNCEEQGRVDEVGEKITSAEKLLNDVQERGGEVIDNQVVVPSVF